MNFCTLRTYFFLAFFIAFYACGDTSEQAEDNEDVTESVEESSTAASKQIELTIASVNGRWEVVAATRNGESTESVNGAFFELKDNDVLLTNIMGEEAESKYLLDGNLIVSKGQPEMVYEVKKLADSTMALGMSIPKYEFELILERLAPDEME